MIFALPLYDDNPTARVPIVTYGLIGMCAGAFLWQLGQSDEYVAYAFGMIPARLFGTSFANQFPNIVPPWATIFTSMFLHSGWLHIGGNMLFLWIFGNNIEDVLGSARYLLLYLVSGAAAALCQAAAYPASHAPMIGASGAIAGVLGAYLLLYPRANVHCFVWIIIFFRIVNVPAWLILTFWFAMQIVSGLLSGDDSAGVAFWAHVGGFVSGLVLIALLRPPGIGLLQPPKTRVFAHAPPGALAGRRTFHPGSGSVPSSGAPYGRPRGPWG
ncbi:MAG: rhomboid family intramembrane serine protease [Alphaproteobacteria bacterium]|nr:rhomboid family intramembrane serine protease [Alphaproteobacteria bacterium]